MNEINGVSSSGLTLYAHVLNSSAQRWNGSAFETYASGHYSQYGITMTEQGASGIYFGNFPTAITDAGSYDFYVYRRMGASQAEGDPVIGTGTVAWTGTTVDIGISTVDYGVALITLGELKSYLKMTTSTDNAPLSALINGVSVAVTSYCGRNFLATDYVEYYDGNNSNQMILKNWPVNSIASLYISDFNRGFTSAELIASNYYFIRKGSAILEMMNSWMFFIPGPANVKVSYNAGYILASIPYDLKLATMKWCAQQYQKQIQKRFDIAAESVGDKNTTFIDVEVPKEVANLLNKYKNRVGAPHYAYT